MLPGCHPDKKAHTDGIEDPSASEDLLQLSPCIHTGTCTSGHCSPRLALRFATALVARVTKGLVADVCVREQERFSFSAH